MKQQFFILFILLTTSTFVSAQKLLEAVEAKDYAAVEQYLKDGEKVNKVKNGQFPLWQAVWKNDTAMVSLLLKYGADANQKFKKKEGDLTLLGVAAQEGSLEVAQLLVNGGADVNEKSFVGHAPIRIAARNGKIDLIKYFLSKGAEVDTEGDDRATPLEHAASKGHLEIVQLLFEKGADINHQDKDGDFPLGEAAKSGFIDVVKYLLSKGADTTLKNKEGYTAQDMARFAGQGKIELLLKEAANK